jgi:hypothetical protein
VRGGNKAQTVRYSHIKKAKCYEMDFAMNRRQKFGRGFVSYDYEVGRAALE